MQLLSIVMDECIAKAPAMLVFLIQKTSVCTGNDRRLELANSVKKHHILHLIQEAVCLRQMRENTTVVCCHTTVVTVLNVKQESHLE